MTSHPPDMLKQGTEKFSNGGHRALAAAIARALRGTRRDPRDALWAPYYRSTSLLVAALACAAPATLRAANASASQTADLLPEVVVTAKRIEIGSLTEPSIQKFTQPLVDTPQSISNLSADELQDLGVTNLNDALRYTPGISLGAGEYSWQGNNAYLRGFTTRDDMFVDGQRDYGYYYRDPFNDQDVQVLKGPSSILFGRGSTGGVINEVSKEPTLAPLWVASGTLGTDADRRLTIDADTPVAAFGPNAAFRLNLMGDRSDVADRDTTNSARWGVAPSLALGIGTPTRLLLSYLHQQNDDVPDYGIPWLRGRPASVDRTNFYGFPDDYLDTDVNILTAQLEHDFNAALTLDSKLRYSRDTRNFRITEGLVQAGTPATTPLADIIITRNDFQGYSTDTLLQDQTDVVARFTTGALSHALVSGVEVGRESPNPVYITNVGVPTTSLLYPTAPAYSAEQSYVRLKASTVARTAGVYTLDTIELGHQWQFMGGIRWDWFDADYNSLGFSAAGAPNANTVVDHVDKAFSYRGAIVYTPRANGSVYFTFGTSFDPSAEGIESLISSGRTLAQANINLDPEKSRSFELGSKWDLADGRIQLTGALYSLEMYNLRVPDPDNPNFNILGGNQRVNGAETQITGHLTDAWQLRATYSYMQGKVLTSTPGGPEVGAPTTITPRNSSTLWSEYQVTRSLQLGVGALQVSSRLGQDTVASYEVAPGYVVMNAFAKYRVYSHGTLQLNVDNLTNKYYFDQLHPFHIVPGEGTVAKLTFTVSY